MIINRPALPWPTSDISLFSHLLIQKFLRASDLASPFFTPRVFLDGISLLFVYVIYSSYIARYIIRCKNLCTFCPGLVWLHGFLIR